MSLRKIKEAQFLDVLQKLKKQFGAARAKVMLAPAESETIPISGARGLVFGNQTLPDLDKDFETLAAKQTHQGLQCGEWFRIGLWTPVPGQLYLFNFGVSGGNARLVPREGYVPNSVEANQLYVVGKGRKPIVDTSCATPFQETCKNPEHACYPERLLAIVLSHTRKQITASDLNSDWDPETRGGFGHATSGTSAFWEQPKESIVWGVLEVPVHF